jgi:hypothetical protein
VITKMWRMRAGRTPDSGGAANAARLFDERDGSQYTVTLHMPSTLAGATDVEALVRDAAISEALIDPRPLVASLGPACVGGATDCWTEPTGVAHDAAVSGVTATGFLGVEPGTALDFTVTLTSDVLPTGPRTTIAAVRIDLVEVGSGAPLDQQYIVLVIAAE